MNKDIIECQSALMRTKYWTGDENLVQKDLVIVGWEIRRKRHRSMVSLPGTAQGHADWSERSDSTSPQLGDLSTHQTNDEDIDMGRDGLVPGKDPPA